MSPPATTTPVGDLASSSESGAAAVRSAPGVYSAPLLSLSICNTSLAWVCSMLMASCAPNGAAVRNDEIMLLIILLSLSYKRDAVEALPTSWGSCAACGSLPQVVVDAAGVVVVVVVGVVVAVAVGVVSAIRSGMGSVEVSMVDVVVVAVAVVGVCRGA